jgi:hypothetical protein
MAKDVNGLEIPTFEQASAAMPAAPTYSVKSSSGTPIPVDNESDLTSAILSDSYSVDPSQTFNVKKYDGSIGQVSAQNIKEVLKSGDYQLETKAETQLREDEQKYGNNGLEAAALGALRGVSFGTSDPLLVASGRYTGDELRGKENANPGLSITGEVVGAVLPTIFSGGTSTLAKGAQIAGKGLAVTEALGGVAEAGVRNYAKEIAAKAATKLSVAEAKTAVNLADDVAAAINTGAAAVSEGIALKASNLMSKSLESAGYATSQAKSIASKMLYGSFEHMAPEAANLAVQGALQGAGRLVTEDTFGTADFNAENLVAYVGMGALVGGTFGSLMGAGKALVPSAKSVLSAGASKAGEVVEGVFGKEAATMNLVDLTPSALAKATEKRANFKELLTETVGDILEKDKPKNFKQFDEAIISNHSKAGVEIGNIYKKADDVLKSAVSDTEATVIAANTRTPESITAQIRRFADDHLSKLGAGVTSAEKESLFKLSDDFVTQANKELAEKGASAVSLQDLAKNLQDRIYSKGAFLSNEAEQSAKLMRKALLNGVRSEQRAIVTEASKLQGASVIEGSLIDQLKALNTKYSVLNDVVHNSKKSLAKDALNTGFNDLVNAKEAVAGAIDPSLGVALRVARAGFQSFKFQKTLAMGSLESGARKALSGINTGLKVFAKGASEVAKAAEPSIVRSLVSSELAAKQENGKRIKPKNEQEAYNNIANNALQAVTDPERVLQHSNRQTASMFEHAPKTAAAVDAKYLQMMQFIASKAKKSSKNTGLFDIGKEIKPSGFETAKMARYLDAITNPHMMLEKAGKGRLSREHVEVMENIFPEMHSKMKQATLDFIAKNKTQLKYNQKLQLGLLLGMQPHESMQPQNIQALQSTFEPDDTSSESTSYNASAVGDMTKSDSMASGVESHEIGD